MPKRKRIFLTALLTLLTACSKYMYPKYALSVISNETPQKNMKLLCE